jgi:hypothetical protein
MITHALIAPKRGKVEAVKLITIASRPRLEPDLTLYWPRILMLIPTPILKIIGLQKNLLSKTETMKYPSILKGMSHDL